MNPFDLKGPEFLVFYIILGIVVTIVLIILRNLMEMGPVPKIDLSDPYQIAYLRGGSKEVLKIASLSLIERGILHVQDTHLVATRTKKVGNTIEDSLIKYFERTREASGIFKDIAINASCEKYKEHFKELGIFSSESTTMTRILLFIAALILVWWVAGTKILIAIERGRHNVQFLVILAVVLLFVLIWAAFPRLTSRGKALLADIKRIFAALKYDQSKDLSNTVMAAAVFGVNKLTKKPSYIEKIFPKSSSNCGSRGTFFRSCGSSYGSSCGGGGCGGGCGGCGG